MELCEKIDHKLWYNENLSKFKNCEITLCILPDYYSMKLQPKERSSSKYLNNWRLNNTLLNDHWVIDEIKNSLEFIGYENTAYQKLWETKKAGLRGNFIDKNTYTKNTERSQIY
jgi:hypothetical protein